MRRLFYFCSLILIITGCALKTEEKSFLEDVSAKLDRIKYAEFYSEAISSAPGDTAKFSEPRITFNKIYITPSDTLVGASSAIFSGDDTTKIISFYDGNSRGRINWEEGYVKIDSFKNDIYPFRLVYYPFYTKINEIIKYSLSTKDSVSITFTDMGDSLFFSLKIYNKHIYFHIKPIEIKNEFIPEDEISQFDIWFRKSDNMPYRMRSQWSHLTFFERCFGEVFNTEDYAEFNPGEYWPSAFDTLEFTRDRKIPESTLPGKKAPDWVLPDFNGNNVSLDSFKSKVVIIKFTGVGCGPCYQSLPFLKELLKEYSPEDLSLIAIETWSNNLDGLKRYAEKNDITYPFLKADEEVAKNYEIKSVPVFFILDSNRIVKKVIRGYKKGDTDQAIKETINECL